MGIEVVIERGNHDLPSSTNAMKPQYRTIKVAVFVVFLERH